LNVPHHNSGRSRLAALLTCHNRREITLASLRRFFAQQLPERCEMTVFLVDDGSTDGTAATVRGEFPQLRIFCGEGSLFWSGGMRWAFAEALKEDFDYYFWLNDDTLLDAGALNRLIATHRGLAAQGDDRCIVVGSLRDPDSGRLTYGGVVHSSRIHRLKFKTLPPVDKPQSCDTANGNALLIPGSVARITGNLNPSFTHSMGDFDYGLRARKLGCSLWIAPGFAGTCRRNETTNTWLDPRLSFANRWEKAMSVKGLPAREWRCFARAHGGILWPLLWTLPYIRISLQSLLPSK
jgi:GT2 family glycosyltransferase